jgi:hypothetical protein
MRPKIGLSFDSMGEAYAYYNLYSWECGFGIRYGKSGMMNVFQVHATAPLQLLGNNEAFIMTVFTNMIR